MRFIILHYHFFKNAGTTIEDILAHSFYERFVRLDTPARNGTFSHAAVLAFLASHPDVQAISSHQISYPVPESPGFLFFDLCFLRDPLDRIRSTYYYFREKPAEGDTASDLANQLGLGEYMAHLVEHHPWRVQDVQVNLIANGIANDPPTAQDLNRAKQRMLETSFLGVVDCFNESVIAGQHFLRPVFPHLDCAHPAVNVSGGLHGTVAARVQKLKAACREDVWTELLRLNALDQDLVDSARVEVLRRFKMVSDHAARLQALEERVRARVP